MLYGAELNIFFARKYNEINYKDIGIRNRFTINAFKVKGSIFGSPSNGSFAGIEIYDAFIEITNEFNRIMTQPSMFIANEDIGSLFIEVDFLNEEPYFKTTIKSSGFSLTEIEEIINAIKKNTMKLY